MALGQCIARSIRCNQRLGCELAMKVNDCALRPTRARAIDRELRGKRDCERPVAHQLGDFQTMPERLVGPDSRFKSAERMIGTIEQPRLEEIEPEFVQRLLTRLRIEISPIEQALMNTDRPVVFAPLAEQFAKREVQFDRLGIDPHHIDERVDRTIGLFTQKEVQPAEITRRQFALPTAARCGFMPGGQPAQPEKSGSASSQRSSNSKATTAADLDAQGRGRTARAARSRGSALDADDRLRGSRSGGSTGRPTAFNSLRSPAIARRWRKNDGMHAKRPKSTPAARNDSSTTTSGARQVACPAKNRTSTGSVLDSAKASASTNSRM